MNPKMGELRKKAMGLPLQPGVYIMKNKKQEIIYIGKAKALKNRVSQYFGSQNNHPEKVRRMVENVFDFDYIITDSEFEALILECSLIKQNKPHYNILLKDDKGYSYIRVTNEKWRRLSWVFQKENDGCTYIGPYTSSFYVKNALDEAVKIFKIPTCSRKFPEDFGKKRPCLNFHIKQCSGVCTGKVSLEDYNESIDEALEFLKGGSNTSLKLLTERMNTAAENLDFELAAKIRDRIKAVKNMNNRQKVVSMNVKEQDVIGFWSDGKKGCFEVFRFSDGRLVDREHFIIDDPGEEKEARTEFITSYYGMRDFVPKNVTIDGEAEDNEILEKWLSEKRGSRVYITVPQRGEQAQLAQMCRQNAAERIAQIKGATGREYSVLEELRQILGMDKIPQYIESYDISNFGGSENVAGMVVFENGKPLKSAYRKFTIKSFEGQDDYASMSEVLERRFKEYLSDKSGKGFGRLPDLILLDGGKGQVSAVLPVLKNLGIDVAVFGMVKDSKHRTRAITTDGEEIAIGNNRRVFNFVSSVQDEVHRFAISFMHGKRSKRTFHSSLTDIDGIGEMRAKALLKHFRTISNISKADLEELENAPKMNKNAAVSVYNYFHRDSEDENA